MSQAGQTEGGGQFSKKKTKLRLDATNCDIVCAHQWRLLCIPASPLALFYLSLHFASLCTFTWKTPASPPKKKENQKKAACALLRSRLVAAARFLCALGL